MLEGGGGENAILPRFYFSRAKFKIIIVIIVKRGFVSVVEWNRGEGEEFFLVWKNLKEKKKANLPISPGKFLCAIQFPWRSEKSIPDEKLVIVLNITKDGNEKSYPMVTIFACPFSSKLK